MLIAIVPASAGVLAVHDDLDGLLHRRLKRRDPGQPVGFAESVCRDGVLVGLQLLTARRLRPPVMGAAAVEQAVVLYPQQVPQPLPYGRPVFGRAGCLPVREQGQQCQPCHGGAIVRPP